MEKSQLIQTVILKNLITNDDFTRKVIPFLRKEYFEGSHRIIFDKILAFVIKYNKLPTIESLKVDLSEEIINNSQFAEAAGVVNEIVNISEKPDLEWLLNHTEKWCQDRAIHLAIMKSISIIDGKDPELTKNALPELLSEALSVCFDNNIGHDYLLNGEERYDSYHMVEDKIPFDLERFNEITKGGLPKKTLNIALAGTGVGKSLFMCHIAGSVLSQGKNALYITMEMSEEKIAERIDANLMNVSINHLGNLSKEAFTNKVKNIGERSHGQIIIKEYPTGAAHVGHFRALL